jgi:hypothetical protein
MTLDMVSVMDAYIGKSFTYRNSHPRSMLAMFQMHAKTAMTTPNTQIMTK